MDHETAQETSAPAAEGQRPEEGRAAPVVSPEGLPGAVEAILLSAEKPVPAARIAEALRLEEAPKGRRRRAEGGTAGGVTGEGGGGNGAASARADRLVTGAIDALNRAYESTGRSFRIELIAGGYRLMTLAEHAPAVAAFHGARSASKLSRAGVETLAIVAYKQPITRAQLEAIRGVACGEVLRSLLERRLITITGRAEELGRPILYGTSRTFLDTFGLASLKDLPSVGELRPVE